MPLLPLRFSMRLCRSLFVTTFLSLLSCPNLRRFHGRAYVGISFDDSPPSLTPSVEDEEEEEKDVAEDAGTADEEEIEEEEDKREVLGAAEEDEDDDNGDGSDDEEEEDEEEELPGTIPTIFNASAENFTALSNGERSPLSMCRLWICRAQR